jgi:hypothetical protein
VQTDLRAVRIECEEIGNLWPPRSESQKFGAIYSHISLQINWTQWYFKVESKIWCGFWTKKVPITEVIGHTKMKYDKQTLSMTNKP